MGCVGGVGRALSYDNDAKKLRQYISAGHGVEGPMEIAHLSLEDVMASLFLGDLSVR